jgi:hypothetical protein
MQVPHPILATSWRSIRNIYNRISHAGRGVVMNEHNGDNSHLAEASGVSAHPAVLQDRVVQCRLVLGKLSMFATPGSCVASLLHCSMASSFFSRFNLLAVDAHSYSAVIARRFAVDVDHHINHVSGIDGG